jgi:WD40 repeat protein
MAIAYSPDASRIATIAKSGIELWDDRGRQQAKITTRSPLGIQFDRSGQRIIAIDHDHVIRIWSLASQRVERELVGHTARIVDAQLSPDGVSLVTASDDGTARVWDLATGASVASSCHEGPVYLARFSPNGQNVASAGEDLVCVWNVHTGTSNTLIRSHRDKRVTSVRWSPDGKYVLTASLDGTARLSFVGMGKDALTPLRHDAGGIESAEFSHDGRYIVTAGHDDVARIWELPDEIVEETPGKAKLVAKLVGHGDSIDHALFDSEGVIVVTGGRDGKARVWDATDGQPIATFEHASAVTSIALSPDRKRLLTSSQDGTAKLWDITRGVALDRFDVEGKPNAIASTGTRTIAVARDDSRVTLWRDGTKTLLRDHLARVHAVAFSPDGRLLASGGEDPKVLVWSVADATRAFELGPFENAVRALAFSPDGSMVATAGDGGVVRLWSTQTHTLIRTLRHGKPMIALAYRDDTLLAALDEDGVVVLWNPSTEQPLEAKPVLNGVGRTIAFSRDGKRFVVGGKADARIFEVEATRLGEELQRLEPPTGDVRAVAFTTDGSRVITAGVDGIAKVWDAAKGKLVGIRDAHGGAIYSIAQSSDGNTLWTASHDRGIRAWNIRVESSPAIELDAFLNKHVPWCLGDDAVVRPRIGECNGQHRTNGQ